MFKSRVYGPSPAHAHCFALLTTHVMDIPITSQPDSGFPEQPTTRAYFGFMGHFSWAVRMHLLVPNSLSRLLRADRYPPCSNTNCTLK